MRFETNALVIFMMLAGGCDQTRTLPPTKNIQIDKRLIALHPENAESWVNRMRRSSWFTEFADPEFSIANNADVESIDEKIEGFLVATAQDDEERGDHYNTGLINISRRLDEYFGQFFMVEIDERQIMVCAYSHAEWSGVVSDEIVHYNFVPWVADGNGANFIVYYDMATNEFERLHVNGSQAGPFGDYPN